MASVSSSSELQMQWLLDALVEEGRIPPGAALVAIERHVESSTHSSEVLTLALSDGQYLRLFCKHGVPTKQGWLAYGHRGGLSYEIEVYRRVLTSVDVSTPLFYGALHHPKGEEPYLLLQHLDGAIPVYRVKNAEAMPDAARWAARFHRLAEQMLCGPAIRFLRRYDMNYYAGWSRRALQLARHHGVDDTWLVRLCEHYVGFVRLLLSSPQTIIHGEYYPKNVLAHNGTIFPIDWESAAIAPGAIDLASLIHRWPSDVSFRCQTAYYEARQSDTLPLSFSETLAAAELYWRFRWLGDQFFWITVEGLKRLLKELHDFAKAKMLL